MTRNVGKVGVAAWEPPPDTKPPPKFGVPDLDQSAAVMAAVKVIKRDSSSEAAQYAKRRRDAESLRLRLLYIPGGGAHLLAADIRRVEVETARVELHNEKHPDEQIGPVDPCGSAGRKRELLSMLPGDAARDLNGERRAVQNEIQRLGNRIATQGQNVADELVAQRVKLEDRLVELTTLIDQRDTLRAPLEQLYREHIAAARQGLVTALQNLAGQQAKIIRKILGEAPIAFG